MNLKQLRQALADTKAKASAINVAAEGRMLTAEERTEFDALTAQCETINGDIRRAEQLLEMERTVPAAAAATIEVVADRATQRPWESLATQLQAIRQHAVTRGTVTDPRLHAALGGNETVDSEGGFLIAPEFAPGLWQRTYEASDIISRCFEQKMSSNRLVINAVDEDSRVDGSRWGGIQSYYLGEAGTYTSSKPKFRRMELIAHKLIALVYATDEQLEDSTAFASYVDKVVPQELAFRIGDNIYNGPGAGTPLGVLNSGALITVAKDSGDSAATVSSPDIFNMWSRMWAPARKNAVWFINQDVEPKLWPLTRGSGTAVELLYTGPGERGNNNSYGVMMGRPVLPVEFAATLGTTGDIVLAGMDQYCFAPKGEARMDSSIHVAFLTGEQAFRWQLRHDGQPFWKKPLTPKNGTNTLSPFVALATRP